MVSLDTTDVVDIHAVNTVPFAFARVLTTWDALYDLYTGIFHAHMRESAEDLNVVYSWTTEKGNLFIAPSNAVGIITFNTLPPVGAALRLGEANVTFISDAPGLGQVQLAPTISETAARTLTLLAGSPDPDISRCTYAQSGNSILLTYNLPGYVGNSFPIGASSDAFALSGTTLQKGGALLTMTASATDVKDFVGVYSYDVQLRNNAGPLARLFKGTVTFEQGVTRGV